MAYLRERFAWRTRGRGEETILSNKDSPYNLTLPCTTASILYHQTTNAYFWIRLQKFPWKISFLMQGKLWKVIPACKISQKTALLQVFFCFLKSFLKFFQYISTDHSNSRMFLCTKWKIQIFNPLAHDNLDNANGCQMMSYVLPCRFKQKWKFKLKSWKWKTSLTAACF